MSCFQGRLSSDGVENLSDDAHSDGGTTLSLPSEGVPSWMIVRRERHTSMEVEEDRSQCSTLDATTLVMGGCTDGYR